jgi:hypothetical protein
MGISTCTNDDDKILPPKNIYQIIPFRKDVVIDRGCDLV